jgi:hypothetical protein
VFPHREPESFLPSNLAVTAVVYDGITSGAIDRQTLAAGYIEDFRQRINTVVDDPMMHDPRVRHVAFADFMSDPVAALKACYGIWQFDWTAEGEAAMHSWLDDPANNSDRYGRHRYTF